MVDNQTSLSNGKVKTFVTYDNLGSRKTKYDFVGVVIAMYSITSTLSSVKNKGLP